MKKFLAILVLSISLITSSQADDVRDFQIEGISIGDSLLKYMTLSQIKNSKVVSQFKSDKYKTIIADINLETFERVQISLLSNDEAYIIRGIQGLKFYGDKNFEDCISLASKIADGATSLFENTQRSSKKFSHPVDKTGKTKVVAEYFMLKDGSNVRALCVDYSVEQEKINKADHLNVGAVTGEFNDFLNTVAYK